MEEADRSMSAQHIHTGFAKRAQQSKVAAGCMGGKGQRRERGQSWRMLTGSTGKEEDGVEDQSFWRFSLFFFSVL